MTSDELISPVNTSRPALFLDRDGVINVDHGYVHRPEEFDFIPGIFELCLQAKSLGYWIFIVTNQAGIGRGYYTEADFLSLTEWMITQFTQKGVKIDQVYFCPYHPEHGIGQYKKESEYRKPGSGMLLQATREFPVDLSRSCLIGDKESDILAAQRAGVGRSILFTQKPVVASKANEIVSNLQSVML